MDRGYVVAHEIVDRYLRGELSREESEEFEAFFLEDQETLEELELMTALRTPTSLSSHADSPQRSGEQSTPMPTDPKPAYAGLGQRQTGTQRWHIPLTAAASLAVGILISSWFVNQGPLPSPSGSMMLVEVATLRSDDITEVTVPPNIHYAAFRVSIGSQPTAVDVALKLDDRLIETVEGLITDAYGDVTFVVPASRLEPGIYRITANPVESREVVFDNQIRLTRK